VEAGKDGFKHLWPKQLGEGCLALSQGTVKEVQLCGAWGLGGWVQFGHVEYSLPGGIKHVLSEWLGGADLSSLCP